MRNWNFGVGQGLAGIAGWLKTWLLVETGYRVFVWLLPGAKETTKAQSTQINA
jgi:hypothetical protein